MDDGRARLASRALRAAPRGARRLRPAPPRDRQGRARRRRFYRRDWQGVIAARAARGPRARATRVICSLWALGGPLEDRLVLDRSGEISSARAGADPTPPAPLPPVWARRLAELIARESAPALAGPHRDGDARSRRSNGARCPAISSACDGERVRVSRRLRDGGRGGSGGRGRPASARSGRSRFVLEVARLLGPEVRLRAQARLEALERGRAAPRARGGARRVGGARRRGRAADRPGRGRRLVSGPSLLPRPAALSMREAIPRASTGVATHGLRRAFSGDSRAPTRTREPNREQRQNEIRDAGDLLSVQAAPRRISARQSDSRTKRTESWFSVGTPIRSTRMW